SWASRCEAKILEFLELTNKKALRNSRISSKNLEFLELTNKKALRNSSIPSKNLEFLRACDLGNSRLIKEF
ncbi:MAG: hypothetical protein SOU37_04560, partial [Campylobacter lanienae]|nr:hypothetical protein [Campylobacteraceae bacterium]MDY2817874.1 hypothetical protein [Campylobacter lanienae]